MPQWQLAGLGMTTNPIQITFILKFWDRSGVSIPFPLLFPKYCPRKAVQEGLRSLSEIQLVHLPNKSLDV